VPEIPTTTVQGVPGVVNCFFSWSRAGAAQVLRSRCSSIGSGFDVIAEESHARQTRAFYPRQVAEKKFALTLQLNGYQQFKTAMDYFRNYVRSFMVAANNAMYVVVPSRQFVRLGVPISGITDEDHVGSNMFSPMIVFESVYDPADPDLVSKSSNTGQYSWFDRSTAEGDPAAKFFYPASASTNDPNATGDLLYAEGGPGKIGSGLLDLLGQKSLTKGE
jgi:hypothetical protein